MSNPVTRNQELVVFSEKYAVSLEKFLLDKSIPELLLNEGYELGRQAIFSKLGIISVVAVHHDCLGRFLEKLATDNHLEIANKASLFLEEVLSTYQMLANDFSDAIQLLNNRSIEFAVRIRALQDVIKEKEFLLKEIYHRVKNNLQIVGSLLNLQVESIAESPAKMALIESATRVKSMALIHEMLYQTENLAKINMADYIGRLCAYHEEIFHTVHGKIIYNLNLEPVYLNIERAIPSALIINELITNVIKHAYPGETQGEIKLSIGKKDDHLMVIVSDHGVGISPEIDMNSPQTLGLRLIYNLTKQLNGAIVLDRNQGTTFTLTF